MQEQSVITLNNPKSPASEAYRVLRTNIQYSSIDNPLKILTITSAGPEEGKTTTVINIAVAFVQSGNRVLIIDGDMRKPKLHKILGVVNSNGLTSILVNRADYKDYVRKTKLEGLEIITCGAIPPNPSELLESNQMKLLVQQVKEDYDMVIIDSPPVVSVTDAAIISAIVDGTILVAGAGSVDKSNLKRAKEYLLKVNANIIGVVLNKFDINSMGKYYHYNYYYGEGGVSKKRKKREKSKHRSHGIGTNV